MDVFRDGAQSLLGLLAAHPYLVLFALVFVEEAGVPLPISCDLLLIYVGYLVAQGMVQPALILGLVLGAASLGALLPYGAARYGGLPLVRRFGRVVRLSEQRLARVERWLTRHRGRAIVFGRQVPGGRVPTSVMSGLFGVPVVPFVALTALGSVFWAGLFILVGVRFGAQFAAVIAAPPRLPWPVLLLVAGIAVSVLACLARRSAPSAPAQPL